MENNMIMPVNEAQGIVSSLESAANELFSSFAVETPEDKIRLYNACNGSDATIKDSVNKVLHVVDVVVTPVEVMNEDNSTSLVPRTTLIDKDGKTFSATSWGVYNSIKKIAAIFGGLHFDTPLKVTPIEVKTKNGFTMNLKLM